MTEQAKVPAIRFAGLLTLGNSVSLGIASSS